MIIAIKNFSANNRLTDRMTKQGTTNEGDDDKEIPHNPASQTNKSLRDPHTQNEAQLASLANTVVAQTTNKV